LIVQSSGTKSFAVRYRNGDGRNVKLTLGRFDPTDREPIKNPKIGAPLMLVEARVLCTGIHHKRESGIDPVADLKAERAEIRIKAEDARDNAFGALVRTYSKERLLPKVRRWRSAASLLGLRYAAGGIGEPQTIKGGLADLWVTKAIRTITPNDCYLVIEQAIKFGAPGLTRRLPEGQRAEAFGRLQHAALSGFFTWCLRHQKIHANPCARVYRPEAGDPRERVLTDDEMRQLWLAADALGYPYGDVTKLLILTALRLEEAAHLRWDELNADRTVLSLPPARVKNKRSHILPLPQAATDLLKGLPRFEGPFVFSFWGGGRPLAGFTAMKKALDKASGVKGYTVHDIRRSTATGMGDLGIAPHVIEKVLNHKMKGVAGVYNRSELRAEKLQGLTVWAAHVQALVGKSSASNVVRVASP
jgi:integrase